MGIKSMRTFTGTAIALLLLLAAVPGCRAQQRSAVIQVIEGKKYYIHKIEKKQSVYGISRLYNVPLDELYRANPELLDGAKAGQEIRVPVVTEAPKETTAPHLDTTKYLVHKVSKGETVYSITRRYNLTEKQLVDFNPDAASGLKENQVLIVGEKSAKPAVTLKDNRQVITVPEKHEMVDSGLFLPLHKPVKDSYNVALLLPFRLEQALPLEPVQLAKTGGDYARVTADAIDFYLGFKKAADSLAMAGFHTALRLYDVDEGDTTKLAKLVDNPDFFTNDFIVGPFSVNGFKHVSKKAAELRIPAVAPVTQQNKILFNNIYTSKTNPSLFTVMETLADYCIDSLLPQGNAFILVLSERDRRESIFTQAFRKYFNDRVKTAGRLQDTVRLAKGLEGVKQIYNPNVRNVVIMLSANQVFIADFTTQLAMFADKKDIVLCGWEAVTTMDNIDQHYLNQLGYTFPHQFNTANTGAFKSLNEYYKSKLEVFPGEYFYIGFEIGWYYLKNLKEHGPDFIYRLDQLPLETNYIRFMFARPDGTTGFDNRGVYILRYHNYELVKTGWK